MKPQSTRRLVLHFNIDKTIVCRDPYNGLDNIPLTIMDCVARMWWGRVTVEEDERKWNVAFDQFSHDPPEEDMMNFSDFLDIQYPIRSKPEKGQTREQWEQETKLHKEARAEELLSFTRHGHPGSKFKSQAEKIIRATYLPKNVREDLGMSDETETVKEKSKKNVEEPKEAEGDEGDDEGDEENDDENGNDDKQKAEETDEQKLIKLFENQKYHLLPSFFKTLIFLKKNKREFTIVIRGEEEFLNPVVFEFNKFCVGEHPWFWGRSGTPTIKFDGSKGTKYWIIDDWWKGVFYRFDDQTKMVYGSLQREKHDEISKPEDLEDAFSDEIENGTRVVANDSVECYVELMELFKRYGAVALSEDKDERRILYIDPADYNTQHTFSYNKFKPIKNHRL